MKLQALLRPFVPPIAAELVNGWRRRFGARGKPEWEYVPDGWLAAQRDVAIKGWNVAAVLDAYKAKWPMFVKSLEGGQPFGISPEAIDLSTFDLAAHNTMMSYGYALALAARNTQRLTMLDWGGGIGHYYLISRALIPGLTIDYTCKDLPLLATYGQSLFPDARFCTDDTCLDRRYDFVLASSSLQYSPEWQTTLRNLAAVSEYLFVTLLPTVTTSPSYVFVQRPYRYGYDTEYLGWCLNRSDVLHCALDAGVELVREFIIGARPPIHRAPAPCEYRGFLFRRAVRPEPGDAPRPV